MPPHMRDERGSVLVVSLIVLLGLMSLGAIAVLSARTESRTGGLERGERVALYAAEAGIAAAEEYVRNNCSPTAGLDPLGGQPLPRELPDSDKPALSDPDATYSVSFYKDGTCDGTRDATTHRACVAIRSRGQGPAGATSLIRLQLSRVCETGAVAATDYADTNKGDVAVGNVDTNAPEDKSLGPAGN
jgi:hypothetical protein